MVEKPLTEQDRIMGVVRVLKSLAAMASEGNPNAIQAIKVIAKAAGETRQDGKKNEADAEQQQSD